MGQLVLMNTPLKYNTVSHYEAVEKILQLELQLKKERLTAQQQLALVAMTSVKSERQRIAQELHDNISQIFACANIYFNLLPAAKDIDLENKKKGNEMFLLGIAEIRKLCGDLNNLQSLD